MAGSVVPFASLGREDQILIKEALRAREFSYCPISKFPVGAALRSDQNNIVSGCNVESCVFTPSQCAERTAICKAVSEGYKKFTAVAVVAFQESTFTSPCGVCRQMLAEFSNGKMDVFMAKPDLKEVFVLKLTDLLPYAFTQFP